MRNLLRILLGLAGLFFTYLGLAFLFAPEQQGASLGLAAAGSLGRSTLRADMTAFFVLAGGGFLYAAIRQRALALAVPMALFGIAFFGRLVGILADGATHDVLLPLTVEALMVALGAFGAAWLARKPVKPEAVEPVEPL
ncbi:DUF4345 domain-containing protein [Erythrobacter sp. 3-20A1M]|uniref:DUF4345 family protein n=1 Tax=Erythrobacter sp. 3-20A1M TaxID=2653850 RepID=UPI001BFC871D|nr:DUF4345 family protein [Erythrobacter sp. 3-20A1M]QWC57181.1 DUF4345 domain-containing protein [Erythrobacter sp. 3-20A1M]